MYIYINRCKRDGDHAWIYQYIKHITPYHTQAQEVPAQIVWQFVTTLGESEPVQGGYRVYV
jgi:hypothetical protein